MATRPSGRRTALAYETKNATVGLGGADTNNLAQAALAKPRQTQAPASANATMSPIAPGRPPTAKATAPLATPILPPRNVHPLTTPEPAPAWAGGRVESARRGAVAYG